MKVKHFKYYIGIILIIFIDSLHILFFENNQKYDIYLFYNHERYLTNIMFDISNHFRFSILTFWLIDINRKIFRPLFLVSLFSFVLYFINYNQLGSLFLIPIYIFLVFTYNKHLFSNDE